VTADAWPPARLIRRQVNRMHGRTVGPGEARFGETGDDLSESDGVGVGPGTAPLGDELPLARAISVR
jgi:hypothetical protein